MAATLEKKIGYRFSDQTLLETALTHSSRQGDGIDNERLEFLGDRVLGLVIADLLYGAFEDEDEGSLAKRHAVLVGRDALAEVARDIDLSAYLKLSPGEVKAGGHQKETILADAMEALIGAVYRDGGYAAADAFVRQCWQGMVSGQAAPPADAKSQLQEWAQGKSLPLPHYRVVKKSGTDHAPLFEVEVSVDGAGKAVAVASSKRAAEKAAAAQMLEKIGAAS